MGLKHLQVVTHPFVLPAWRGEWEPISPIPLLSWGGSLMVPGALPQPPGFWGCHGAQSLSMRVEMAFNSFILLWWVTVPSSLASSKGTRTGAVLQTADLLYWFCCFLFLLFYPFLPSLLPECTSAKQAQRVGMTLIQIAAYMWPFKLAWTL